MWQTISDRARSIHPTHSIAHLLILPFWLIGVIVGSICAALFGVLRWAWAATAEGLEQTTRGRLPRLEPQVVAQWALVAAIIAAAIVMLVR